MQLVENNKALLLRLKNPDPVLATIPKSKLLSKDGEISQVLVKWGLEEFLARFAGTTNGPGSINP
jgi:hypothetical protein